MLGLFNKENVKILVMDEILAYWLDNSFKTFYVKIIFTSRDAVNVILMLFEMCVFVKLCKIYQYAG